MQTFLPYADLRASCAVLDDRRLGKQRVETFQILRALTWPDYAWKTHPAVRMWRGFTAGLVRYGLDSCQEWVRRGHTDAVAPQLLAWSGGIEPVDPPLPPWFGLEALHLSHRSSLLRKDPAYYRPIFGADEPDDLPYLWPPAVFPRWPVRAGDRPLDLPAALAALGLDTAQPGQAQAVAALVDGRDVLLVARPGSGGSTAGLLAGLMTPGPTLWISPPAGPLSGSVPRVPGPPSRPPSTGDAAPAAARPPSVRDLAAMAAEGQAPEFVFTRPDTAPGPELEWGLVVLDRADQLPGAPVPGRAPVLAVVGRADADERAALTTRLGLRDPVHAGGGWDVPSRLSVVALPGSAGRRPALASAIAEHGPGLVVVASRARADSTVTGLRADGLRAESWAAGGMRTDRAARAVAAWRQRRVDALVVPIGPPPPLGRGRLRLLIGTGLSGPHAWRDLVAELEPATALLLLEPDAPPALAALAAPGCRRAALLAPYGEPVDVPCGRCDVCARRAGHGPQA